MVLGETAQQGLSTPPDASIKIVSFGFKYGTPREANFLFDVRFLPNPYFVPELKELDGTDPRIKEFVRDSSLARLFLASCKSFLDKVLPAYSASRDGGLTVCVGCTGGRHRSVVIAEILFEYLKESGNSVTLLHRDIQLG